MAGRFRAFAATYPHLALYARLASAAADDDLACSLLAAARPGQERPVLFLAALHDVVLRSPDGPAAAWFATPASPGDPWPDVRATLSAHEADLRAVISTRSTQTNEVNRSVYVAALLARAAADVPDVPVALVELGCSAGLLLGVDRYSVALGDVVLGDAASLVRCAGALSGGSASAGDLRLPTIVDRVGLDADPVDLADEAEVRWLEACLWPDQPERLDRFRTAVARLRPDPPRLVAGDMVDDLPAVLASVPDDAHVVVLSSWALTYVERLRRPAVAAALAAFAASAGRRAPVTWATAEPPGCVPGVAPPADATPGAETVLALHRWPVGRTPASTPDVTVVGHAHPHATTLTLL